MVSWKRVRAVALIGIAFWAVSLVIFVAIKGEALLLDAVWHCSFLLDANSPPGQPEPSQPYCAVAATLLLLQALLVFFVFFPLSAAFSFGPLLILLFLDVLWPWWQARRRSDGVARSS